MTTLPQLKFGIMGLGFIGKTHAKAASSLPFCIPAPKLDLRLTALFRTHPEGDEAFIRNLGAPSVFTDLDEFLTQSLDFVDICSPNHAHMPQVLHAAAAGKNIYCEKPLARNLAEARQMTDAVRKAGVRSHSAFLLRYLPAVVQAKALLASGALGEALQYRAIMYHSSYLNTQRPTSWRLRMADSGGGAWMDLGSHLVNLSQYLVGEPEKVSALQRTHISNRPEKAGASQTVPVDVDDWCLATFQHSNGAVGTIEVSRVAAGTGEDTRFELFCSKGALRFSASKPETLEWLELGSNHWVQGISAIDARINGHPILELWAAPKYSLGMMVNAHLASLYDFSLCLLENKESEINFENALQTQLLLELANQSAKSGGECLGVS